ncbi:MAG: hypothetical protein RR135_06325, partial [Oscillospiraceae bacterium]
DEMVITVIATGFDEGDAHDYIKDITQYQPKSSATNAAATPVLDRRETASSAQPSRNAVATQDESRLPLSDKPQPKMPLENEEEDNFGDTFGDIIRILNGRKK